MKRTKPVTQVESKILSYLSSRQNHVTVLYCLFCALVLSACVEPTESREIRDTLTCESDVDCPGDTFCDAAQGSCLCPGRPGALAPDCTSCHPRFAGTDCDQCADSRFTGDNCDQCSDSRFTGLNCNQCVDTRFTGVNCDQCADPSFTGEECDQCTDGRFTGDNCDQCADAHLAGENCDECSERFTGPFCDQCADPRFVGRDCDLCSDIRFAGENCDQCSERFIGVSCDQCADSRFTGDYCNQCADPSFMGVNCDQCTDTHFAGENCDECSERFTGPNCNQCADDRFMGINCDQCTDPRFTGVNCNKCITPGGILHTEACPEWIQSTANDLYFTKSEVTVAQYAACVSTGRCRRLDFAENSLNSYECNYGNNNRSDHPMNCINWFGAGAYCRWVGARLPTEEEWYEEASNNGTRAYPWDNMPQASCDYAIMSDQNAGGSGCGQQTSGAVCSKPMGNSVSGLCDLSGNAWEWTSTLSGTNQVLRGGSWHNHSQPLLQASSRSTSVPSVMYVLYGFRCVSQTSPQP
jgi:formylglycine-generating enzyme